MGTKIHHKSMKNRGCVADAFLERFGGGLGRPMGVPRDDFGIRFGTIFAYKSEKTRQGSRKGAQNLKKRHLKIDVTNCIEK